MADVIFPEGLSVKDPHEKAPDFVRGRLSIKKSELIPWLDTQEGEWVNMDIKRSKGGNLYLQVDTWKPTQTASAPIVEGDDDLPF
tara:strand:- start:1381 stop:1635 length:255 start_codon:yes stop_codon:yes gene_type:complete